jgi:hypothetical protein
MANLEDLNDVFEKFCAFGSNRNLAAIDSNGSQMDGAKFAKFARDSGLVDNKKITTTGKVSRFQLTLILVVFLFLLICTNKL